MIVYSHTGGRCAVIGGYISRDPKVPKLKNRYLYGDLCDGIIRSVVPDVTAQKANARRTVGVSAPNLSSFGRGPQQRIYFTQTSGELKRFAAP